MSLALAFVAGWIVGGAMFSMLLIVLFSKRHTP